VNEIKLPENETIAMEMLRAQERERGWVGRLFGTKEHAPTNIGAVVVIILAILLTSTIFSNAIPQDIDRGGIITTLLSTITFVVGLMIGREGKV